MKIIVLWEDQLDVDFRLAARVAEKLRTYV